MPRIRPVVTRSPTDRRDIPITLNTPPSLEPPHVSQRQIPLEKMKMREKKTITAECAVRHLIEYYKDQHLELPTIYGPFLSRIVIVSSPSHWPNTSGIPRKPWPYLNAFWMKASTAGLLDLVDDHQDGEVPALWFSLDTNESVQDVALRLNTTLLHNEEHKTWVDRKKQGCWGILFQIDASDLELALVIPYHSKRPRGLQEPTPMLFVRNHPDDTFKEYKRVPLSELDCRYLGFHVEGAMVTAFRFLQKGRGDMSWVATLKDVKTFMERHKQEKKKRQATTIVDEEKDYEEIKDEENDSDKDKDKDKDLDQVDMAFFHEWPVTGTVLSELYEFTTNRTKIKQRQEVILAFANHVLGTKTTELPSYNAMVVTCCRFLEMLPEEHLQTYDAKADEWRKKHAHLDDDQVPSWGMCKLVLKLSTDMSYLHDEENAWVVTIPATKKELIQWDTSKRLILLDGLMGFAAFYINMIRSNGTTPPLRGYHEAIEHCSRRLGLKGSCRWSSVEEVEYGKSQTKAYKEHTVLAPQIFSRLITQVVGKQALFRYVLRNSMQLEDGASLDLVSFAERTNKLNEDLVENWSRVHPQHTARPLLQARHHYRAIIHELQCVHQPMAFVGPTTCGKSTMLNGLSFLLAKKPEEDLDISNTSSSSCKKRWIHECSHEEKWFKQLNDRYVLYNPPADNTCLFHALVDQLQLLQLIGNDTKDGHVFRTKVVNYIRENPDIMVMNANPSIPQPFVTMEQAVNTDDAGLTFQEWCKKMNGHLEWGNIPILLAFSSMYTVRVHIIAFVEEMNGTWRAERVAEDAPLVCLVLHNGHFYSIRSTRETQIHGSYDHDRDLVSFLNIYNSMWPSKRPLDPADFQQLLVEYDHDLEKELDKTRLMEVLFNPEPSLSTEIVVPLLSCSTWGNPMSKSSTHFPTVFINNNTLSPGCVRIHFHPAKHVEDISINSKDHMETWFKSHPRYLEEHAPSHVLTLRIPGGYKDTIGLRVRIEGLLNMLNGVCHKGMLGENIRLRYPGILRMIEISMPMMTPLPALEDFIGDLESDKTICNRVDEGHKLSMVPMTDFNKSYIDILEKIFKTDNPHLQPHFQRAIVNYQYMVSRNAPEKQKSPMWIAQFDNCKISRFKAALEEEYTPFVGTQLTVVACDVACTAAMIHHLKQDHVLHVQNLWGLPMAVHATGVGPFLYAIHDTYANSVLDTIPHVVSLGTLLKEIVGEWRTQSYPHVRQDFSAALCGLDSEKITNLAWSIGYKEAMGQMTKNKRRSCLIEFDHGDIRDVLEDFEEKATNIQGLGMVTLREFNSTTKTRQSKSNGKTIQSKSNTLDHLVRLLHVLEKKTTLKGKEDECRSLFEDLTKHWVDCTKKHSNYIDPYDSFALFLKKILLNLGLTVFQRSCHELKQMGVDVEYDLVKKAEHHSMLLDTSMDTIIKIKSMMLNGSRLLGVELKNHSKVLVGFAKYVMERANEQMSLSTLKIKAFLEPTKELVVETLLHFLRGNKPRILDTLQKASSTEEAAKKIAILLQTQLDKSFIRFTLKSTLNFIVGDHHPGLFVTKKTGIYEDREVVATVINKHSQRILKDTPEIVKKALFSPELVKSLFKDIAGAIWNVKRKGIRLTTRIHHKPSFLYAHDDYDRPQVIMDDWIQHHFYPQVLMNKVELSLGELEEILVMVNKKRCLDVDIKQVYPFDDIRQAIAFILGVDGADIYSLEEFDHKLLETDMEKFYKDHRRLKQRGMSEEMALQQVYDKYKATFGFDTGKLVKTLGMTVAQVIPEQLAYLVPGGDGEDGRHIVFRYLPRIIGKAPLSVAECLNKDKKLKQRRELGIERDLYQLLETAYDSNASSSDNAASIRRVLDGFVSTGMDLVFCNLFELMILSIVTKRAISVMIVHDDQQEVQEHVFRPELLIKAPESCEDRLLDFQEDIYAEMANHRERVYFGQKDNAKEPMEVVVMYKGGVYVLEGVPRVVPPFGEKRSSDGIDEACTKKLKSVQSDIIPDDELSIPDDLADW